MAEARPFTLEDAYLGEDEAARLLEGRRIRRGDRVMDPKAQLLGEFIVSLRPPDQLPTPEELRVQFRRMVDLFDGPPPEFVRTRDLTCPGPDGEVPLRLFEPGDAGSPAPLLLYLHGGGWVQGDLDTHRGVCGKLAAWAGCKVLAVHYRLAPEHKFPAGLEDCHAAWRWLAANAEGLGADPARLAIGGDSAGANLTAAVCQIVAGEDGPVPAAQLLIYPRSTSAGSCPRTASWRTPSSCRASGCSGTRASTSPRPSRSRTCGPRRSVPRACAASRPP